MKKDEDFLLVGHLQVMDEPLSSLYIDQKNGLYFLFVRTYEETDEQTYVLSEVNPTIVLDYMEGRVGLKQIFSSTKSYYYIHNESVLHRKNFKPISTQNAYKLLDEDGLDDLFDKSLGHRSTMLKRHLKQLI